MRTLTMSVSLFASLFFFTQTFLAQTPEGFPDLLAGGMPMENPADLYGNEVLARVDQMIEASDQNGALMLLTENFNRFISLRMTFFGKMLDVLLAQDNVQEARQFYRQYASHDRELARAGIDRIYSYYARKKDSGALIEWIGELMGLSLPDDLKPLVFTWQLNAICSEGVTAQALPALRNCIGKFSPETCRSIFSRTTASLIESGKFGDVERLLNMIEKEVKGIPALQSFATAEKIKILFLQEQWKEGEASFMEKTADLSDEDLAALISSIAQKAQKNYECDAVDRLCMSVIQSQKENNRARNEAASSSLNMLKRNDKITEIPARFAQLMAMGLPRAALNRLYCDYFYAVIMLEKNDLSKQMLAFGNKLDAKLDSPDDKKWMALLLMDGLFAVGEYERSLQVVAENEKLWEAEWLDSTRAKIGAHLELQNGNYKEAVEGFRKFMDYVAKDNSNVYNPLTGQLYTPEMLLGFNALRIGNILRDNLQDEDGALKAYDEAEVYFQKALSAVKPNSKELEYINQHMAQLAARKKK